VRDQLCGKAVKRSRALHLNIQNRNVLLLRWSLTAWRMVVTVRQSSGIDSTTKKLLNNSLGLS